MISLGELILYKGLYHIRINKSVYLCLACVYRLTIYLIITSIFPIYPAQAHNLRHRYIGALYHLKDQHAGRSIVHLLLLHVLLEQLESWIPLNFFLNPKNIFHRSVFLRVSIRIMHNVISQLLVNN